MDAIKTWVIKICITAIFIIICDMIIPKKFKSLCNMILGIMMILVIISPINNIIFKKNALNKKILENNNFLYKSNIYINRNLKDVQSKNINDIYKKQVEQQLDTLIEQNFHIKDANVQINSKIDSENNFVIESVNADIGKNNTKQESKSTDIKPVSINVDNNIEEEHKRAVNVSNSYKEFDNVKKYISNFLNISLDKVSINIS
jgi:stage III sporulation protein AF